MLLFQIIKAPCSSSPLSPSGPVQDSTVLCARRHCLVSWSPVFWRVLIHSREFLEKERSSQLSFLASNRYQHTHPSPSTLWAGEGTVNAKLQGKGSIFSRMYLQTYRIWVHIRRVACAKILGQALHGTFKVRFVGAALTPWDHLPQCLLLCRFTWLPG